MLCLSDYDADDDVDCNDYYVQLDLGCNVVCR